MALAAAEQHFLILHIFLVSAVCRYMRINRVPVGRFAVPTHQHMIISQSFCISSTSLSTLFAGSATK